MTYTVPAPDADPKARMVLVTDAAEIEAVRRSGWRDPIGSFDDADRCWATRESLEQFRQPPPASGGRDE